MTINSVSCLHLFMAPSSQMLEPPRKPGRFMIKKGQMGIVTRRGLSPAEQFYSLAA